MSARRSKKIKTKTELFIGLPALKVCPECSQNIMPYMNQAMCSECASNLGLCEWTGKSKSDNIFRSKPKTKRSDSSAS